VGNIKSGVAVDDVTGTYDPVTGNYSDPGIAHVEDGVTYYFAGELLTGTLEAGDYDEGYADGYTDGEVAQYAADQIIVMSKSDNIDGGIIILGVEGTGVTPTDVETAITAALASYLGTGARTVTITVNDGTDPLENARVRLTAGADTYVGSTNASGIIVFHLDDATWTVVITKFGYTFTAMTLVVSGNTPHTYSMTQTVTPSSTPGQVTGFVYCYDENGVAEKDVTIKVWLTAVAENMGVAYDLAPRSATSNAEGLVQFSGMFLGATYSVQRGLGPAKAVTIPANASDPYELVSVIGSP